MQQGTGVDLNPPKTPLSLKELMKTSVVLGCELRQGLCPITPGVGLLLHPRKCRGELSPLCLKRHRLAQFLENLQKLRCHHSRAGMGSCGAQGMCVALPGEELSCPWLQDWGICSEGQRQIPEHRGEIFVK